VRFLPDYVRFGLDTGLTDDMRSLFLKRARTCAVTAPDVNVHVNGEDGHQVLRTLRRPLPGRRAYARVYEHQRALGVVATAWDCADSVSFVNGICTVRGAPREHVTIDRAQGRGLAAARDSSVKPRHVRDNLFVMVNATVPDPVFDGRPRSF
jgi:DNA gyrase/topoisomerase IV subunit B